jgi:hypothetical protein
MPIAASPTRPNPLPRTTFPASHPAMIPTTRMTSSPSSDRCIQFPSVLDLTRCRQRPERGRSQRKVDHLKAPRQSRQPYASECPRSGSMAHRRSASITHRTKSGAGHGSSRSRAEPARSLAYLKSVIQIWGVMEPKSHQNRFDSDADWQALAESLSRRPVLTPISVLGRFLR